MILLALLLAAAPSAETPRAYMERVYASYRKTNFNPLDLPVLYFTPQLVAAMKEDARLAHGEVGYVDGDPICQCQDSDGLHARVIRVTARSPSKAVAEVLIDFSDSTARRVKFNLVRTAVGWRIADVSSREQPSFLGAILASNRRARAKR